MSCELCPERRAMYCADADLTLCQSCYETWADVHAETFDLSMAEQTLHRINVGLETPLARRHYIIHPVNSPLTIKR